MAAIVYSVFFFLFSASGEGTGDNWTSADINNTVPQATTVSFLFEAQNNFDNMNTLMILILKTTRAHKQIKNTKSKRLKKITHSVSVI